MNVSTSESSRLIPVSSIAWSVGATAATLLLIRALAKNPYEYYLNLRWIVTIVAVTGVFLGFKADKLGWTTTFGVTALVYNPLVRFRFERSTWEIINIATSILLVAAIIFIGLPLRQRWIAYGRHLTNRILASVFFATWSVIILDVLFVLTVLCISYLARGDETLSDEWDHFRSAHRTVLYGISIAATSMLYFFLVNREARGAPTVTVSATDSN